jgi:hypothetical protein
MSAARRKAVVPAKSPPLQAIASHLREQQGRVYHTAQSVEIAMKAIDAMDEEGTKGGLGDGGVSWRLLAM